MDTLYYLAITNEKGIINGHLSSTGFDDDKNRFNPLTVLGDLLKTVFKYEAIDESASYWYSFKNSYWKHPFFYDKEIERIIVAYNLLYKDIGVPVNHPFYKDWWRINSFIVAVKRLHECFNSQTNISLSEIELTKAMNQFQFTFDVQLGMKPQNNSKKNLNKKDEIRYHHLYLGSHVTTEFWWKYQKESIDPIRFAYTCYSLEEVLFAIWHYLVFHGFTKFNQCHHCGTYFATNSLKNKYCNDNSPYENYTHLDCEQAVRNIKQKLSRRRKIAYNNIWTYRDVNIDPFLEEFWELNDKVKERSSVQNLKELEYFLDKKTVREKWLK